MAKSPKNENPISRIPTRKLAAGLRAELLQKLKEKQAKLPARKVGKKQNLNALS